MIFFKISFFIGLMSSTFGSINHKNSSNNNAWNKRTIKKWNIHHIHGWLHKVKPKPEVNDILNVNEIKNNKTRPKTTEIPMAMLNKSEPFVNLIVNSLNPDSKGDQATVPIKELDTSDTKEDNHVSDMDGLEDFQQMFKSNNQNSVELPQNEDKNIVSKSQSLINFIFNSLKSDLKSGKHAKRNQIMDQRNEVDNIISDINSSNTNIIQNIPEMLTKDFKSASSAENTDAKSKMQLEEIAENMTERITDIPKQSAFKDESSPLINLIVNSIKLNQPQSLMEKPASNNIGMTNDIFNLVLVMPSNMADRILGQALKHSSNSNILQNIIEVLGSNFLDDDQRNVQLQDNGNTKLPAVSLRLNENLSSPQIIKLLQQNHQDSISDKDILFPNINNPNHNIILVLPNSIELNLPTLNVDEPLSSFLKNKGQNKLLISGSKSRLLEWISNILLNKQTNLQSLSQEDQSGMSNLLQRLVPNTILNEIGNPDLKIGNKPQVDNSNTDQIDNINLKPFSSLIQHVEANNPFWTVFINPFGESFSQKQPLNKLIPIENQNDNSTPNAIKNVIIIILPSGPSKNDDLKVVADSNNNNCDENFQCKSGYFCFAGKCEAICHDLYNPCPVGFSCQTGLCNKINVIHPNIVLVQPPKILSANPPENITEQPLISFQSTKSSVTTLSQVPSLVMSSRAIVEMSTEPITSTPKEPILITQQVTNDDQVTKEPCTDQNCNASNTSSKDFTSSMTPNINPPSTTESMSQLLFNITNRLLRVLPDQKVSNRMLNLDTFNPESTTITTSVCTKNKDCPDHYFCFNGLCHPECHKIYNPCPTGYICIRGWCKKILKRKLSSISSNTNIVKSSTFINKDVNTLGSIEVPNTIGKDKTKNEIIVNDTNNSLKDNVDTTPNVPIQDYYVPHLGKL